MPLSEHEQRMLEQMERALYAEDPKFASALEGSGLYTYAHRRAALCGAGFLVGIGLLMGGLVAERLWVSVVGFLVMLACAVIAIAGWRRSVRPRQAVPAGPGRRAVGRRGPRQAKRGKVMDRIEERWQRRRDAQGQ